MILSETTNSDNCYSSLAQILCDIFVHALGQKGKLEEIASFKSFKKDPYAQKFRESLDANLGELFMSLVAIFTYFDCVYVYLLQ